MLKVLTTIALKGVLAELAGDFQRQTGHEFAMTYGPSGTVFDQCRGGATYDLVIATPDTIDTLISEGSIEAGSRKKSLSLLSVSQSRQAHPIPTLIQWQILNRLCWTRTRLDIQIPQRWRRVACIWPRCLKTWA